MNNKPVYGLRWEFHVAGVVAFNEFSTSKAPVEEYTDFFRGCYCTGGEL